MYKKYSDGKSRNTVKPSRLYIGKLVKNALLVVAIVETIALPIMGFTWANFLVVFLLALIPVVFIVFLTSLYVENGTGKGKQKKKKNPAVRKPSMPETELFEPKRRGREQKLVVLEKKNFNWNINDIEKDDSISKDKAVPVTSKVITESLEDKEIKKRYNPYRSPFEPIHPVDSKQEEPGEPEKTEPLDCDEVLAYTDADEAFNVSAARDACLESAAARQEESSSIVDRMYEGVELENKWDMELYEDQEEPKSGASRVCLEPSVQNVTEEEDEEAFSCEADTNKPPSVSFVHEDSKVLKLVFKSKGEEQPQPLEITSDSGREPEYEEQPYILPHIKLLKSSESTSEDCGMDLDIEYTANKLIDTLASFGVGAKVLDVSRGPSVTRYELQPNAGVKVSKIVGLSDDIALNLAATGVRIEAPIPGKAAVGIEVPNKEVTPVLLRDVIESDEFQNHPSKLAFAVGKDVAGRTVVGDIARMPHMLIAGATGSGKSVCINTLIASILYKASPREVKLLMVDPKVVELGIYNGIPHLLIPVVTDPKKAAGALNWAVVEMTTRYKLFADNNVRDLKGYNSLMEERREDILPQIVIIIDELADLMMVAANDVEDCICRLAQMARAAGMHLVIATQRPSVDVITGVIKANIPSRISFAVSSQIDSRTILDMAGAEKLLGRGDMLYNPIGEPKPVRVQGGFISDKEVEAIVSTIKENFQSEYDQEILEKINSQSEQQQHDAGDDDNLLPQVIEMVLEYGQASASLIQRKFKVGYSRAARIMDQMESWGVVGPAEGSKPRQLLITRQEWDELNS